MTKHIVTRTAAVLGALLTILAMGTATALGSEPKPEPIGRSGIWPAPPEAPMPDPGLAVSWPAAVLVVVGVIAVAGLAYSVAWRHAHHRHAPA